MVLVCIVFRLLVFVVWVLACSFDVGRGFDVRCCVLVLVWFG